MKRIRPLLGCVVALAFVVAAAPGFADPDPNSVHVKKLTYAGSGCPPGSTALDLASDAKAFTLLFSEFIAEIGPGIPQREARKNCQVSLTLHVPGGFTYGIAAVDYRGFAEIADGALGRQQAVYYFQGQAPQATTWRDFWGPHTDNWHIRDEVEWASIVWAPCGVERSLNINAQLRLEKQSASSRSSSVMAMDSEDGSLNQIYHIVWRPCP